MNLKVEGVWCKTRTEFDKLSKTGDYDLSVSYYDIFNRLIKSDPNNTEPSDIIISIYILVGFFFAIPFYLSNNQVTFLNL